MIERRPAVVASCTSPDDVAAALAFARGSGLEVSVRGGGHGYAGLALTDGGLMVDLSPMKAVGVDPEARRAQCGGGVTWGELDAATQEHGLAVPGGFISTTGIAGLCLGGGFGWLSRIAGLTSDNLIGADVVTADGSILRASESENDELFWALRGGGGNFGVVTSFEFQLHPVGPLVHLGAFFYAPEQGGDVFRFAREYVRTLPARARNTLSLPEIVVLFKEFVTELTATGPVIIGIDELDKIATAERAQAFLIHQVTFRRPPVLLPDLDIRGRVVELRATWAANCAMPSTARSTTSSSRVPLDYPTALKLAGRVIGLSSPYSALAYCLGGGLPREIIRWTRALVLARASVGDGLKELAHHVVGEDIGRKVFASMLALSRQPSPDSAVALQVLGDLVPVADAEWLLEQFSTRREFPSRTDARHAFSSSSPRPVSTTDDGHHAAVVDELFAYFYFCATVLEVFTDELDEDDFGRLTGALAEPAGIDQLVHARQCFSSSPDLAVSEVTAFRGRWGLRCATAAAA